MRTCVSTTCKLSPLNARNLRRRRDLDWLDDHLPPHTTTTLATRVRDYRKMMHRLEARIEDLERSVVDARQSHDDASYVLGILEARLEAHEAQE